MIRKAHLINSFMRQRGYLQRIGTWLHLDVWVKQLKLCQGEARNLTCVIVPTGFPVMWLKRCFPILLKAPWQRKAFISYNISKHSSLHYPSVYFCTFYIFFYSFVQFLCLHNGDERPLFAPSFCNPVDRGRERVANTIYQRWFSSKTTRGESNSKIFLSHLGTVLFGIQVFSPILYCHSFAFRELFTW